MKFIIHPTRSLGRLDAPDKIGVPYGDIERDDDAAAKLERTYDKMYRLGCEIRSIKANDKRYGMRAFRKTLEAIYNGDDDRPLKEVL